MNGRDRAAEASIVEPTAKATVAEAPGVVRGSSARGTIEEPPPLLGTWRNVYLLVALETAVLVLAFYALTRWAS